ncbi:hypothetical protein IFM89_029797 [Coptis chinensis]|uniref:Uncharacterized protein n=1 Tax=Coptis chinensis TaxID=261450 RepID=A0A835IEH8_9MAGN|nr:hypothetical protein IFM89_029797 [Coptis chinensis]
MDRIDAEEKMEVSLEQDTPLSSRPKGGLLTMPFIIANESFEKVASYGLMPNMIFYLMKGYRMSSANGTSVLQLWSALTNFTPILGAFLSDSYVGRFQVIAMGSLSSLLGVILLWLTAMIPRAKPPMGESPNSGQLALLFSSFVLMSIGAGGIRPFIVYIQDHLGWKLGFGIPVILMLLSALTFFFGYPLYVQVNANKSLFTGLAQVVAVTFKNRSLAYPVDGKYHYSKESNLVTPSKKLRFLNKACIIRDPENDITPDGSTSKPWNVCTVDQVEALKSLIRLLPIWSTGIIIYMTLTQSSLTVLQAYSMDRHLTSNFKIPAGSFSVFTVVTLTIWVAVYDRAIVPLLARFTGQPRGFSNLVRMGIGLVLSILAMVVAAVVEIIRRRTAINEGLDTKRGIVGMSAFWLVPQFCVGGLAEGLNAVGQVEFYYSQLPKNMSSVAMALFSLTNGFAGLLGSFLVKTVDRITKDGEKQSWVASNPNRGHYDYYYWFLAILSTANFIYFLLCCWVYGPSSEEVKPRVSDDQEHVKAEESYVYK